MPNPMAEVDGRRESQLFLSKKNVTNESMESEDGSQSLISPRMGIRLPEPTCSPPSPLPPFTPSGVSSPLSTIPMVPNNQNKIPNNFQSHGTNGTYKEKDVCGVDSGKKIGSNSHESRRGSANILMQSTGGLIRQQLEGLGKVSLTQYKRDIFRLKEEKETAQSERDALKEELQEVKLENKKLCSEMDSLGFKGQKTYSEPAELLELAQLEADLQAKDNIIASQQQQLQIIPKLQRQVDALTKQLEEERSMSAQAMSETQQVQSQPRSSNEFEVNKVMQELEKQGEMNRKQMTWMNEQLAMMGDQQQQLQSYKDEVSKLEMDLVIARNESTRHKETAKRLSMELEVVKGQLLESRHRHMSPMSFSKTGSLNSPFQGNYSQLVRKAPRSTIHDKGLKGVEENVSPCKPDVDELPENRQGYAESLPINTGSAKNFFLGGKNKVEAWLNAFPQSSVLVGDAEQIIFEREQKEEEGGNVTPESKVVGIVEDLTPCDLDEGRESGELSEVDVELSPLSKEDFHDRRDPDTVGGGNFAPSDKAREELGNLKEVVESKEGETPGGFEEVERGLNALHLSKLEHYWEKMNKDEAMIILWDNLVKAAEKLAEMREVLIETANLNVEGRRREEELNSMIVEGNKREQELTNKLACLRKNLEEEVAKREREVEEATLERKEAAKMWREEWEREAKKADKEVGEAVKRAEKAERDLTEKDRILEDFYQKMRVFESEKQRGEERLEGEIKTLVQEKKRLEKMCEDVGDECRSLQKTLKREVEERNNMLLELREKERTRKLVEGRWQTLQERVSALQKEVVVVERTKVLQIEEARRQEEVIRKQAEAAMEALEVVKEEKKVLERKCENLEEKERQSNAIIDLLRQDREKVTSVVRAEALRVVKRVELESKKREEVEIGRLQRLRSLESEVLKDEMSKLKKRLSILSSANENMSKSTSSSGKTLENMFIFSKVPPRTSTN